MHFFSLWITGFSSSGYGGISPFATLLSYVKGPCICASVLNSLVCSISNLGILDSHNSMLITVVINVYYSWP